MINDEGANPPSVGFGKPPETSRYKKGQSGNPKGRPRNRRREIPYDHVLSQMVTIREEGRERRVTAAEAFILSLTKKGLEGDHASARASLAAIEEARAKRLVDAPVITGIICKGVSPGSVGCTLDALGMAIKLDRYLETATYRLKPWVVKLAVDRMKPNQLSPEEQVAVVASTRAPEKVAWPNWWSLRG